MATVECFERCNCKNTQDRMQPQEHGIEASLAILHFRHFEGKMLGKDIKVHCQEHFSYCPGLIYTRVSNEISTDMNNRTHYNSDWERYRLIYTTKK